MTAGKWDRFSRREALRLFGVGGGALLANAFAARTGEAQTRRETLVIGIDISDTVTLDPARVAQYTPPMSIEAAYETLVTMSPGDYINVKPALATHWARTPDGKGWRFTMRKGVAFASGRPVTVADVKWSLDRVLAMRDQPAQYLPNVDHVAIVDGKTVDIVLKKPAEPLLTILAAPEFVVFDRQLVEKHGGTAAPGAKDSDKATAWLNTHSAGSGAYRLVGWQRNAQIQFVRNEHYWRGKPPFARVVIRHMSESAAQLLAIRRGDIDAAFNLIPEQIAAARHDKNIRIDSLTSLDFVYMALTQEPAFNKALAVKEARQAIGYAIDYDGIKNSLLGGAALRPAHFLPIGVSGSTEEIARRIGFRQDLAKSKALLAKAGYPNGFAFELAYGNAAIEGVTYQELAQKIQADLARVGIEARLRPMDQVNLRTEYTGGKSKGGVLTFWNPPAVENELWAAAVHERVAKRVHWNPPADVVNLVHEAATEADPLKRAQLWIEWQKRVVDQANHFILFQPIYKIAVRNTIGKFPLTAAGWMLDLYGVAPKTA